MSMYIASFAVSFPGRTVLRPVQLKEKAVSIVLVDQVSTLKGHLSKSPKLWVSLSLLSETGNGTRCPLCDAARMGFLG